MSVVQISETGANVRRVLKVLEAFPVQAQSAITSAAKRAGEKGKTEAGRFAAAQYTITKGSFMAATNVRQSVQSTGAGATLNLMFAGGVLNILTFRSGFTGSGLSTQVKTGGGATLLRHVFAGKGGAYERVGKSRLPIEKKFGPSTGHMMQNEVVTKDMEQTIKDTFNQRLDHEVYRILNRY